MTTKIYPYGARVPLTHLDIIDDQISKGFRYRNDLVANERKRREELATKQLELFPECDRVSKELADLDRQIEEHRADIQREKQRARRNVKTPELNAAIKALQQQKKPLYEVQKSLNLQIRGRWDAKTKIWDVAPDPIWVAARDAINDQANERAKALRDICGLFSANYQLIERTVPMSGPAPQFSRWREYSGKVAVYIQDGLTVDKLFDGTSTLCKADPIEGYEERSPRTKKRTIVRLRVQRGKGQEPFWAEIPIQYHRPLPENAVIRWVWLMRRPIPEQQGSTHQFRYDLQFTVNLDEQQTFRPSRKVGVDWAIRKVETGVRVAAWVGDDGHSGEVIIPQDRVEHWGKPDAIQGDRADLYTSILADLRSFLGNIDVPEWLADQTRTVAHWGSQSQGKLHNIVCRWRDARFSGDELVYESLDSWRKRDKHLWCYQNGIERSLINWRKDFFRKVAHELAQSYGTAFIESTDIAKLRQNAKPEEADQCRYAWKYGNIAAPGLFQQILGQAMETRKVNQAFSSQECPKCGTLFRDYNPAKRMQKCEPCNQEYDVDFSAAAVLLARGSSLKGDDDENTAEDVAA